MLSWASSGSEIPILLLPFEALGNKITKSPAMTNIFLPGLMILSHSVQLQQRQPMLVLTLLVSEHYLHSRGESLVEGKKPLEKTLTCVTNTVGCPLPVPVHRNSLIKAKPCVPTAVFTRATVACPLKLVLSCCQLCLYRYRKLHVANHLPNTL